MNYDILATGSSGNAVVINGEILIDCGVSMKKLRESGHIKNLKLVLLTHEHGDHFNKSTVKALHHERPSLRFLCCNWMVPKLLDAGVTSRKIDVAATGIGVGNVYKDFGEFLPFKLVHDVPNCGWKIKLNSGERLLYATDTATLNQIEAKNYDLYMIEANHTKFEIASRIAEKQSRGEFCYETRAAANHLSREQAMDWLARNAGPQSKYVFLHQHQRKE